jgi:NTE family protein
MFGKNKIGLALGGGGAKGFAHLGALKVFEKNKIEFDMVSGTSIGALVGALHCAGFSAEKIEKLSKEIPWKKMIDLAIPKEGLIKGDRIEEHIRKILEGKQFSDLKKPFFITATDIKDFREVIFNKGDLAKAIRASISIPGVFNPVTNKGRLLVDGGVIDNLPIEILKINGAKNIVGINLFNKKTKNFIYDEAEKEKEKNSSNIILNLLNSYSILEQEKLKISLKQLEDEIIISPDVESIKIYEFNKSKKGIEEGEKATEKRLKDIKKIMYKKYSQRIFNKIFGADNFKEN